MEYEGSSDFITLCGACIKDKDEIHGKEWTLFWNHCCSSLPAIWILTSIQQPQPTPEICHHLAGGTDSAEQMLAEDGTKWLVIEGSGTSLAPGSSHYSLRCCSCPEVRELFLFSPFNPVPTWKLRYSILGTLRVSFLIYKELSWNVQTPVHFSLKLSL